MKKWEKPEFKAVNTTVKVAELCPNSLSGTNRPTPSSDTDLGTCGEGNNPYWAGNGMTLEEAQQHNPFWSGGWGCGGGWGSTP